VITSSEQMSNLSPLVASDQHLIPSQLLLSEQTKSTFPLVFCFVSHA
jgi:hypothetical protein